MDCNLVHKLIAFLHLLSTIILRLPLEWIKSPKNLICEGGGGAENHVILIWSKEAIIHYNGISPVLGKFSLIVNKDIEKEFDY